MGMPNGRYKMSNKPNATNSMECNGENCMNITKKENIIFSNFCNDFGSTEYRVPKYV